MPARGEELAALAEPVRTRLDAANAAREQGLAACRRTIQAASRSIRAVHRLQFDEAASIAEEAQASLREAQQLVAERAPAHRRLDAPDQPVFDDLDVAQRWVISRFG